jgi:hypothetical protein
LAGYDTFQLDNHYARFLLESRTRSDLYNDFFAAFAKAHQLLSKQMAATAHGYYPYRVARLYADFIRERGNTLLKAQVEAFDRCCQAVIGRISKASSTLLNYPVVEECRLRMEEARSIAAALKPAS